MKKAKTKAAHFRTPVEKLGVKATIEHYNAVLLEDIRSQMNHVIDVSENTRVEIIRDIREFRTEVKDRFDVLEAVAKGHSNKIDKIAARADNHEERISSLESVGH